MISLSLQQQNRESTRARKAVNGLKEYLNERRSLYESIKDDEPLFASTSSNVQSRIRHCTPTKGVTLDLVVKRATRKAGIARWNEGINTAMQPT